MTEPEETSEKRGPPKTEVFEAEVAEEERQKEEVDPLVGKLYGKWKLQEQIGVGGVGVVYLAKNTEDGRASAVKLLKDTYKSHPLGRARFKREGELTTRRLRHPNVLQGWLFGEQAGVQYFVAEFIEGETLEAFILREGKVPADRTVVIMRELLAALQHTHERGVVHRDLKPANVMVTPAGRVKLIDYGLASDEQAKQRLTQVKHAMGSPSYMSPEQAKGEQTGVESDLYSCGILMFLMLSGVLPFRSLVPEKTRLKQIYDPAPALHTVNKDVPLALDRSVGRLMEKDPSKRIRSARELSEELGRAASRAVSPPPRIAPPPEPRIAPRPAPRPTTVVPTAQPAVRSGPRPSRAAVRRRPAKPPSSRNWIWIVAVIVVVLGIAAVAYFVFGPELIP
ncbi:MAG: serine/threonine-protein kinase [Planctomycetota bacterium]|jgi:serine/threonine-protein kinase